jgi:DNA-binding MarR family transcriptional regulator
MNESILLQDIAKKLNPISWDILRMLEKNEDLTYTNIKERLSVSQEKAAKEIIRLEGGILIESERDKIDARILRFRLTEYGLNIIQYKK